MALNVRIPVGGDLFIGPHHFTIEHGGDDCFLLMERDALNSSVNLAVTQNRSAHLQIGDDVAVITLANGSNSYRVALSIDAPKSISILRGDLYRKTGGIFVVSSATRESISSGHKVVKSVEQLIELASPYRGRNGWVALDGLMIEIAGTEIVSIK